MIKKNIKNLLKINQNTNTHNLNKIHKQNNSKHYINHIQKNIHIQLIHLQTKKII